MAEKYLIAGEVTVDSMVQLQRKEKWGKKRGEARAGRVDGQRNEEAQTWWGILYTDDEGIVSRSPEGLEKMMTVIVTPCSAFGLTTSEAKTEIMCLQTKSGGRVQFTVTARPGVQTNGRVCVLGRGYQRRLRPQRCRGNASNQESMGVLRAV